MRGGSEGWLRAVVEGWGGTGPEARTPCGQTVVGSEKG